MISTSNAVSAYMESSSSRGVMNIELPLIPNVGFAVSAFNWFTLNSRMALYYALIPALIHEAHLAHNAHATSMHSTHLPAAKRDQAITACIDNNFVTDESMRGLLGTFITGNALEVPQPLLQLMNAGENRKVRWIPYHMMEVLNSFAPKVSFGDVFKEIVHCFNIFTSAKKSAGDSWETLFVVVFLIRAVAGELCSPLFPSIIQCSYTVSLNRYLKNGTILENIKNVDDLIDALRQPPNIPHLAAYYPSHAQFAVYDLIAVFYYGDGTSTIVGYQLKENNTLPKTHQTVSEKVCHNYWLRGNPSVKSKKSCVNWSVANKEDIIMFFGESGKHWIPDRWSELSKGNTKLNNCTLLKLCVTLLLYQFPSLYFVGSSEYNANDITTTSHNFRNAAAILNRRLDDRGFQRVNVAADGNCYFGAVAAMLNNRSHNGRKNWNAQKLRKLATNYLKNNPELYARQTDETLESYLARMSIDREFAADEIIVSLGLALDVRIHVWILDDNKQLVTYEDATDTDIDVHVYYNGMDHYDALALAPVPAETTKKRGVDPVTSSSSSKKSKKK